MTTGASETSEAAVERLREKLECLQCGYSLRGLAGDLVRCPECGVEHDVALQLSRKWTRPWYKAPGFERILMPLTWLVCGSAMWIILLIVDTARIRSSQGLLSISGAALVVVIWLWMLWRTRGLLHIASAPWCAVLAHVIFGGYLVALWLFLVGILGFVFSGANRLTPLIMGLVMVAVSCFLFWLGRRGERYIASLCIRQHLLRSGDVGDSDAGTE